MGKSIGELIVGFFFVILILSVLGKILEVIAVVVGIVVAIALWCAPFVYYVIVQNEEQSDAEFWYRCRVAATTHLWLVIAVPFIMFAVVVYANPSDHIRIMGANVHMDATSVKAIFYAGFVFLFAFGFAAYFLGEIFPWKEKAPVFNGFLSFLSAFFLASFTALVVYDGKATTDAVSSAAARFSDLASTALSIVFLMMGVFLFWKKVKAYF